MPTAEEVMEYLGIDYADTAVTNNINRLIKVADRYLKGAVGREYPTDDPKAKELALIVISDLYDNRGMNEKVSGNTRRLVDDLSLQLRIELRKSNDI